MLPLIRGAAQQHFAEVRARAQDLLNESVADAESPE